MELCYAYRRGMYYPYTGAPFLFPPPHVRPSWLRKIKSLGFDAIEVGLDSVGPSLDEQAAGELRRELADAGVPCGVVRGGGGLTHPRIAQASCKRMEQTVHLAGWLGARVANVGLVTPATDPTGRGARNTGEPVSQGGSRTATEADYARSADGLREVATIAADLGVSISIEVHQHSIADTSWGTLHLLDLIGRDNVGANPDLGNVYWTYEEPEETSEAAIVALAPRSTYWHCKNLMRIHLPELNRSLFQRVPLPDGEIDYRFALTAMLTAGYHGYVAIEGLQLGDQLTGDGKSAAYMRSILHELEAGA